MTRKEDGRTKGRAGWWLVLVSAAAMAFYALGHVVLGDRIYADALADSFRARPWGIYPHALVGLIGILIGPFQFRRAILQRRRNLHRTLGKVYVVVAMLTGLTGLYMAVYSHGGWITHLGFGGMALAILITTATAYRKIRARDVVAHREWMIRSYAVMFSAVTLRLWLPVFVLLYRGHFTSAYLWVAWMSWVPNLLWAEWYLGRRRASVGERLAATLDPEHA